MLHRCSRYDLQGKELLKTQEKFYLADASLKYCIMGFNPKSIAAMLENIVYFELRRKGYDVYIGKNATKEIDFVVLTSECPRSSCTSFGFAPPESRLLV